MAKLIEVPNMGVVEFPDNMSDQEISSAISKNLSNAAERTPKENPKESPKYGNISDDQRQETINRLKSTGRGTLEGISDIGRGIEQIYLGAGEKLGLLSKGSSEKYREVVNKHKKSYAEKDYIKENPGHALAGEILGGTIATAPAGGIGAAKGLVTLAKNAGKIKKIANVVGQGAAQGAVGGGLQYDETGNERLKNTIIGGAVGAAVPLAVEAKPLAKRILKGKSTKETEELARLSKENKIDLTVPELRDSVAGKHVEAVMEKVPLSGGITFRQKQIKQFEERAKDLAKTIGGDASEDFGDMVKSGFAKTLKENKAQTGKEFDQVSKLAEKQGGKVTLNNTRQEAEKAYLELSQLPEKFQNKPLMKDIENYLQLQDVDFNVARKLRSRLGDEVSKLKKASNTGVVSAEDYRISSQLFGALEKDIDSFAEQSGGALKSAYDKAKKSYLDKVVPFKKGALGKSLADDADADLLIGSFLKPDRPKLASKLVKNTDNKGLTAARAAILNDALEKSYNGEVFSALRFAQESLRLGKANKVLFSKDQIASLKGYEKLAKAAERASKFALNPETGARNTGILGTIGAAAAIKFNPLIGSLIVGGSLGLSRLFTSKIGRKLLTHANNMPEKASPKAWQTLMEKALIIGGVDVATKPSKPDANEVE